MNSSTFKVNAYRSDIDGLRAIAVISVVIFHLFPSSFKGGFIGVDIFFVISGYLITKNICETPSKNYFDFVHFYIRRILRLFPALLCVLMSCIIAGYALYMPLDFENLGFHIFSASLFFSNFTLWFESGYFDVAAEFKPLLHLWSLGVEEQFYLVWPPLLWLATKRKLPLIKLIIPIFLISFLVNILLANNNSSADFYFPLSRMWEFLLGAAIANKGQNYSVTTSKSVANITSFLGLTLIISGLLIVTNGSAYPGWSALLPTLGTAFCIYAGGNSALNKNILSNKLLVWVGLISYSLYLWHWPVIIFLMSYLDHRPNFLQKISIIFASAFLAHLTYKYIEIPARHKTGQPLRAVLLIIIMLTVGGTGLLIYINKGFPNRFLSQPITPIQVNANLSDKRLDNSDAKENTLLAETSNIKNFIGDLTALKRTEAEFRPHECFLYQNESYTLFEKCKDNINPTKKTIFLLGDSFAADLYPGLSAVFGDKYNIIQRTMSECPPFLEVQRKETPYCQASNREQLKLIEKIQPDTVILSALWIMHDDINKLQDMLAALKLSRIQNIYVVGPQPLWDGGLPRSIFKFIQKHGLTTIPVRMSYSVDVGSAIDDRLRNIAIQNNVTYISPKDILCDSSGCLTRVSTIPGPDSLMTWDHGHLTPEGSKYLVLKFPIK
jgi:peptidoglycan/LPS O-acetylase OafA/YrhL